MLWAQTQFWRRTGSQLRLRVPGRSMTVANVAAQIRVGVSRLNAMAMHCEWPKRSSVHILFWTRSQAKNLCFSGAQVFHTRPADSDLVFPIIAWYTQSLPCTSRWPTISIGLYPQSLPRSRSRGPVLLSTSQTLMYSWSRWSVIPNVVCYCFKNWSLTRIVAPLILVQCCTHTTAPHIRHTSLPTWE